MNNDFEIYNNAYENSVNTDKRKIRKQRYKKRITKAHRIGITKGVICTLLIVALFSHIKREIDFHTYPTEYTKAGYDSVNKSRYAIRNTSYFAYNHDIIVASILSGDFNCELYGAYKGMEKDGIGMMQVIDNMDTVVHLCHLKGITDCLSFYDYCKVNGFVKEDNEIDVKAYEKAMLEYLNLKEANEKVKTLKF